jgi:hypothetical protein
VFVCVSVPPTLVPFLHKLPAMETSPTVSPLLVSMFGRYCERYLARHFHAVRLSKAQRPDPVAVRASLSRMTRR